MFCAYIEMVDVCVFIYGVLVVKKDFKKSNSQGTRSPSSLMGEVPLFRKEPIYTYTKHDFLVELGYYESVFYKDHQSQKD